MFKLILASLFCVAVVLILDRISVVEFPPAVPPEAHVSATMPIKKQCILAAWEQAGDQHESMRSPAGCGNYGFFNASVVAGMLAASSAGPADVSFKANRSAQPGS